MSPFTLHTPLLSKLMGLPPQLTEGWSLKPSAGARRISESRLSLTYYLSEAIVSLSRNSRLATLSLA